MSQQTDPTSTTHFENSADFLVQKFIHCLRVAETQCDPSSLINLFSKDAELTVLTRQNTSTGLGVESHGPLRFWSHYLHAFDRIESQVTNIILAKPVAVLEWRSSGRLPMGLPIDYNGISILEFDEDKICRFRTYYDSAAFLPHSTSLSTGYSETVGLPEINTEATS